MKGLSVFIMILSALWLSGCSGAITPLTVTDTMLDKAGNAVSTQVTTVADASVAKEQAVHKTLQKDVDGYYDALKSSGAKMKVAGYQEIALADGSKGYLPLMEASFVEAPDRDTRLPTAPSEHPAWRVAENLGGKIVDDTLIGYSVGKVSSMVKGLAEGAGTKIEGNGNNVTVQQKIKAGNDIAITSGAQSQDNSTSTEPEEGTEEEPEDGYYYDADGNCWVSEGSGCSCESYEAGDCTA